MQLASAKVPFCHIFKCGEAFKSQLDQLLSVNAYSQYSPGHFSKQTISYFSETNRVVTAFADKNSGSILIHVNDLHGGSKINLFLI